MLFNFHTHKRTNVNREIYNFRLGSENIGEYKTGIFSVGIHPWDVGNIGDIYNDQELRLLKSALEHDNCVALGEVGLDKTCGTDFELQKKCFQSQLSLAGQKNIKVLTIHCVKAFQEIIEAKKANRSDFIWVLHGFNGGKQLIEQLLKHGFYFSLGSILFHPKAKIISNLQYIPLNRLFLETDETNDDIKMIYLQFASLTQQNIEDVESQMKQNIHAVLPTFESSIFNLNNS